MTKILIGDTLTDVTPEMLAEMFCEMGSDGQARFFNRIAEIAQTWKLSGLYMQLQWITEDDGLRIRHSCRWRRSSFGADLMNRSWRDIR